MYVIRNKALDDIYSTYKTHDLFELTPQQLEETCKLLDVKPVWNTMDRGGMQRRVDINRSETIKLIRTIYKYDIYMDQNYWTEKHLELDQEMDLIGQLKKHTNGRETFDLMADVKLGISNLEPDQTQEADFTDEWLEEVLAVHPMSKFLEIKRRETDEVIQFNIEKDDKGLIKSSTIQSDTKLQDTKPQVKVENLIGTKTK